MNDIIFENNNIIDNTVIDINIKNLNDKYEIYYHKHISTNYNIQSYEGVIIRTNQKIIIDVYDHSIIFFAKRLKNNIININHPNIINILEIIIDTQTIFFIKPYLKKCDILIKKNLFTIGKELIRGIKFLFDKNIYIKKINIDNIYYDNTDNLIKISPIFDSLIPQNKIVYGSPLFSSPEMFINIKNDKEELLIINFGTIILNLLNKDTIDCVEESCEFYDLLNKIFHKSKIWLSISDIYDFFNKKNIIKKISLKNVNELFNIDL